MLQIEDVGTQLAEDIYGPDHPRTANTYSGLASVLTRQGRHAEAEARSRAALAIHLAASGERFWRVGTERRKLAEILIATGRTAEAEELLHAPGTASRTRRARGA